MNLQETAYHLAAIYQLNPKIQGILLAGSVSRGWQDHHSDIELHILWSEPPSDGERMSPINTVKGKVIDFYPYEDEEWSETYLTTTNIKLEISNFLVETIENTITDVVEKIEIDFDKQCILASLNYGEILYGDALLNRLKKRVEHYPSQLADEMITSHLDFGSRWNNRRALLDRMDWLMLYDVICTVQKKLLATLFGINKMYVHHPAFKWMHQVIELMEKKPANLDERLTQILTGNSYESIPKLELLIDDVLELVKKYAPHIETDHYKQKADFVRPENLV